MNADRLVLDNIPEGWLSRARSCLLHRDEEQPESPDHHVSAHERRLTQELSACFPCLGSIVGILFARVAVAVFMSHDSTAYLERDIEVVAQAARDASIAMREQIAARKRFRPTLKVGGTNVVAVNECLDPNRRDLKHNTVT